ncbi:MAG: DUF58 domain-containing protein [Phycisphaerales bacterium]|nr:MAG: DUF58 domain-containing protein [Phycisphaerales bacterium]
MTTTTRKYFQPEILNTIGSLELRARHVVEGFLSGMHQSPYRGFSVEFAAHRAYTPGDDLRHVDWRVFAKADRFFIKEYEVETNMRIHLLLDCSESMAYPEHPGTSRMTKWDYAATLAASLAHLSMRQQDAAGLLLFDEAIRQQIPPSTKVASLRGFAQLIESSAPDGRSDVRVPLLRLAERVPRRGVVVILSDLLLPLDAFVAGIERLRFDGHDVLVMHVLDHDELEFPFIDRTLFEGMEGVDVEILTDPQALRSSYLESLRAYLSKVRAACLNHRVDYALISTADALDVALTRFLANRMHRIRARA